MRISSLAADTTMEIRHLPTFTSPKPYAWVGRNPPLVGFYRGKAGMWLLTIWGMDGFSLKLPRASLKGGLSSVNILRWIVMAAGWVTSFITPIIQGHFFSVKEPESG